MPLKTVWDPSFSVGSATLDRQHRHLLQLCNSLAHILEDNSTASHADFHEVLHALAQYAREHFSAEEALLKRYGYPGLGDQAADHLEYTRVMAEISYMATTAGFTDQVHLQEFIANWWTEHILKRDAKYRDFLLTHGAP